MASQPPPGRGVRREIAAVTLCLAATLASQLPWVPPTNFAGFDEWLIIDLVSRGIIDVPHGNRPVELLWHLPAALGSHTLAPYLLLHACYSFLLGLIVFLLCRRLAPGRSILCFLTAVLCLVWGPGDLARLSTVERTGYAAFAFATFLAIWLLVESWMRRSVAILAFGALVAFLVARSYEAVVPLLVCAPLLLPWLGAERGGRLWAWVAAWEGVMALAVALVVLPAFVPTGLMAYQLSVLGLDLHPGRVGFRVLEQYLFHIGPVLLSPVSELATPAVPLAVLVFAGVWLAWTRLVDGTAADGPDARSRHWRFVALGLAAAGLGYGVLVLTPTHTGLRMQVLSAPGIALFFASAASLAATFLPPRWRRTVIALMAAWIVAVGTGRTVAMQKRWDEASMYTTQMRMLSGLTREVPDVRPNTLLVLLDDGAAWRASYGFRHAVLHLYQGRAVGHIPRAWNALYPAFFTPEGIRIEPWPALRAPWGARVALYRYGEIVAVRYTSAGKVEVLKDWPAELPPLPPGARYDPRPRTVEGGTPPPERAILDPRSSALTSSRRRARGAPRRRCSIRGSAGSARACRRPCSGMPCRCGGPGRRRPPRPPQRSARAARS